MKHFNIRCPACGKRIRAYGLDQVLKHFKRHYASNACMSKSMNMSPVCFRKNFSITGSYTPNVKVSMFER